MKKLTVANRCIVFVVDALFLLAFCVEIVRDVANGVAPSSFDYIFWSSTLAIVAITARQALRGWG